VGISAGRRGSFTASRLAVALAATGGICLVASAVVARVLADHSSSDSSASSLTAVGLAGFGVSAVLAAAAVSGSIALARLRRPDPAATARRHDLPGERRRDLRSRVVGRGTLRLAAAFAALGGACLAAGVLAGVLATNLSATASSLMSLSAAVLVALGLLAELAAATLLASGGTARLWRRIRRI
jgi:hypothetical protein